MLSGDDYTPLSLHLRNISQVFWKLLLAVQCSKFSCATRVVASIHVSYAGHQPWWIGLAFTKSTIPNRQRGCSVQNLVGEVLIAGPLAVYGLDVYK